MIDTKKIIHEETIQNYKIVAKLNSFGALAVKIYEIINLADVRLIWQDNNINSARIYINAQLGMQRKAA